jgi:hypothetical protein
VLELMRTKGYFQFAGPSAAPQSFSMLESGNSAFAGTSFSQTDTSDYSLTATSSAECSLSSQGVGTLAAGGVCALTASYTPTTYAITRDTVMLNGNLSNAALSTPNSVQLVLTGPATAPAASIALDAFSPISPVYGETVTASATVTGGSIPPAGAVVFTVDASTQSAALTSGTATVMLTGLSAGNHSVSASYTSSNGYAPVSTSSVTLVVGKATPAVTATGTTCVYSGAGCSGGGSATGAFGEALAPVTLSYTGTDSTSYGPTTTAPFNAGTYAVTASFAGNSNYLPAISTPASITIVSTLSNVTASVTITSTGFLYSRVTRTYNGTVTVTNISGSAIAGPIQVGFANLPASVTLANATTTNSGVPFITLPAGLAAGQATSFAVQFNDPSNLSISYSPIIYSGAF